MSKTAVVYCRISKDATEEGLGVEQQEGDCRKRAATMGYDVAHVYIDNDTGASAMSKKARPQYDAMIEAVEAGGIDAVFAYSNSRLTRKNMEFEKWIQLYISTGTRVLTVVSGDDDLSTADGKMVARYKAVNDAAEAERTSERVTRMWERRRDAGKPKHNRYRTYGFNQDFSLNTDEADRIRDAYRRVIAGESVQSIVERWKADGVVVGGGKTLYHSTISNIIKNPLYKGVIQHKGEEVAKADIELVVAEDVWNAAQTAIKGSSTANTGRYARRYLLGGIVSCGLCGFTMAGKARPNENYNYECSKASGGCGKQGVSGKRIEPYVLTVVRQKLIVGYKYPATADYSEDIKTLEEDIESIGAAIRAREMRAVDVRDTLKDLNKQLTKFREQQEEAVALGTGRQFDDWDSFVNGTIYEQVATVRRHIKGVVIEPATSRAFDPKRLTIYTARGTEIRGDEIKSMTSSLIVAKGKDVKNV